MKDEPAALNRRTKLQQQAAYALASSMASSTNNKSQAKTCTLGKVAHAETVGGGKAF
jgi:hypothetical protein